MEKFVAAFAKKDIHTFDQIDSDLVDKMENDKTVPAVICNFLREKLKERTSETTDFVHKECLILWQSNYDELRKADEKTKEMGNLEQAEQDAVNA